MRGKQHETATATATEPVSPLRSVLVRRFRWPTTGEHVVCHWFGAVGVRTRPLLRALAREHVRTASAHASTNSRLQVVGPPLSDGATVCVCVRGVVYLMQTERRLVAVNVSLCAYI